MQSIGHMEWYATNDIILTFLKTWHKKVNMFVENLRITIFITNQLVNFTIRIFREMLITIFINKVHLYLLFFYFNRICQGQQNI